MQATKSLVLRHFSTVVVVAGLAAATTSLFGATVPTFDGGILQLANRPASLVGVTTNPTCINFGGGATCVAGTTHQMVVSGSSATFATGSTATDQIQDLMTYPGPPLVNFETVSGGVAVAGATVHFDLTQVVLVNGGAGFGNCTSDAPNNICSPPNSPFTLQEDSTGTQVTVQFSVLMNAYTGTSATGVTPYRGVFSTQQSGVVDGLGACTGVTASITHILNCEAQGGTILATWSATESPISRPTFTGCSVTQGGWGAPAHGNNPGTILNANFPASGVEIGSTVNNLIFTSANAVRNFLPQGGPPSFLTGGSLIDQTSSAAGVFAGQVLALRLNVQINNMGSLVLFGTGTSLDGKTVAQILAAANLALGTPGALPSGFDYSSLNDLIDNLNQAFDGCVASSWAMSHLH